MATLKNYKEQLEDRYRDVRNGVDSTYLLSPTQANLRDLCLERMQRADETDKDIFRRFFGYDFSPQNMQRIRGDRDKFRSITKFLKGESELSDTTAIEMFALLVDYRPRPFSAFRQSFEKEPPGTTDESGGGKGEPLPPEKEREEESSVGRKTPWWKSRLTWIGVSMFVIPGSVLLMANRQEQCMQWQVDHYTKVDCQAAGEVIGYDEHRFKMKKMPITPQTIYFVNGKPVVWYVKKDGIVDCFNQPGVHPVTRDSLRPISQYMAQKLQAEAQHPVR